MAMNKFSYGSFDASNTDIAFASTSGYTNPTSELETRKQLSYPLKELKTFINNTVSVDEDDNAIQLVVDNGDLKYRTEPNGALIDLDFTTLLATKQDTLVSGTNIKTINNTSLLGSGDLSMGYGIDKSNVIATGNTYTEGNWTYTTTQNCWLIGSLWSDNVSTGCVKLDGTTIYSTSNNSSALGFCMPVGKGTVINIPKSNHNQTYTLYGLK